ncbi:unnamed protein product, partial [Iphiclides podalirius]
MRRAHLAAVDRVHCARRCVGALSSRVCGRGVGRAVTGGGGAAVPPYCAGACTLGGTVKGSGAARSGLRAHCNAPRPPNERAAGPRRERNTPTHPIRVSR